MPPNRKTELSTEDLPTLDAGTTTQRLLKHNLVVPVPTESDNHGHAEQWYWDWPVDSTVTALQEAEKARHLTSAYHVQQNLVEAAALVRATQPTQQQQQQQQPHDSDEYWDMPSTAPQPNQVPPALFRHLQTQSTANNNNNNNNNKQVTPSSYWDWPTTTDVHHHHHQEAAWQRVWDGQRARRLTSAHAYQQHLCADAQRRRTEVAPPPPLAACHDHGYWDF